MSSSLALDHLASGKVRELYDAGEGRLLLVASDRISAFDVVLPTPIPDKGRVLTALSLHWFALTGDIVRNHVISAQRRRLSRRARAIPSLAGRALLVRRLEMLPLECVVRGYLAGSGLEGLRAHRRRLRHSAARRACARPTGCRARSSRPRPRRPSGHDENITAEQGIELVGERALPRGRARLDRALRARGRRGARARHHPRRHEVRVRHRRRRRARGRRRGADARLVALLAGRQLRAGLLAAVLRQAVRARLAGDAALGQDAARARAARRGARRHGRALPRGLRATRRTPVRELPRRDGGERA